MVQIHAYCIGATVLMAVLSPQSVLYTVTENSSNYPVKQDWFLSKEGNEHCYVGQNIIL